MREGLRRWLIRSSWAGLLLCGGTLVGLRIGRPLYYTDGQQQTAATDLAAASMLHFGTPQPEIELPGPVRGRIAQLPDGRLLYGREQADGSTDLVVFDPARPGLAPEPAYGLNTAANELAPAVAADGRVYFASDRAGGTGGYDLYVATLRNGGFGDVQPVPLCNTGFDETDPAPSPDGSELLFVRIDRAAADGHNGTIYRVKLGAELDPEPLFPFTGRRATRLLEDRDPAFTPDGAAVWFLRRETGQGLHLLRSSRLLAAFDEPAVQDSSWGTGELRSPLVGRDGRLLLLKPGAADLLYVASPRELYPWWPGQRLLELWLVILGSVFALLLLLLHLGRRWSTLDMVTQCILLSLLLHLLVMLWLMHVEIEHAALPGDDGGGATGVSVQVIGSGGGGGDGPQHEDVAALASFHSEQRDLAAATAAPRAAAEAAARASDGELAPAAQFDSQAAANEAVTAAPSLQDASQVAALHAGSDAAAAAPAAAALGAVVPADAKAAPMRSQAGPGAIQVQLPSSGVAAGGHADAGLAGAPASATDALPAQTAHPLAVTATVHDPGNGAAGGSGAGLRAGSDVAPATGRSAAGDVAAPAADSGAVAGVGSGPATGGSARDVVVAGPAAGAQLEAGGHSGEQLAATGAGAPAPTTAAASHGNGPHAQLHDADGAAPAASGVASGGVRAGTDAPAGAVQALPLSSGSGSAPNGGSAVPLATRSSSQGGSPSPSAGIAGPGDSLEPAGGDRHAAMAGSAALAAAPASSPARAAQPMQLRDGQPAGGAAGGAPLRAAAAGHGSALQPLANAMQVPGPGNGSGGVSRPVRGSGSGPRADYGAVAAPGSLLERNGSTAALAAPIAAPLAASTPYSNRFGPAKAKALEQFGGTVETERAVAMGLRYLASVQHEDGAWGSRDRFDDKYGLVFVGKTGLCLLAFLGAGHSPSSNTEYSATTARAIDVLLAQQDPQNGSFGPSSAYGHGIATYALAECYALTKDDRLRPPLVAAVAWILQNQGPRRDKRNVGGWGYFSPQLPREDDYARTSVSAWMVMALESAKLSGIAVPEAAVARARGFFEQAWDRDNQWFRYNHKPSRVNSAWPTLPASTPAGAFCLMLMGVDKDDERVVAAADYTAERRPTEYRRFDDDAFVLRAAGNVYFWYYGSLCCFLAGGEAWQRWNETLRTVLPAGQQKDGSFPPIDVYAGYAGDNKNDRSYTTAMCVLSLEVYYRYFTPLLVGR
jgi:hypothetical protein